LTAKPPKLRRQGGRALGERAAFSADAEAADPGGGEPRRSRTTTQAPAADVSLNVNTRGTGSVSAVLPSAPEPAPAAANGRGNALGAAFASAMQKPPPALEEEWYVSIDGDQAGPYTLAEAQRWVASRPFDAELHCWSEGFDDWLPVDKVSHFRNLRKARQVKQVTTPPPIPKPEKPLFAATMASIEKAASSGSMPAMKASTSGPMPAASTPAPLQAKTNGSAAASKPAFDSFAGQAKLQRADELNRRYRIESVPTVVVNGKYTSDAPQVGSYEELLELVDELVRAEREAR
jgi:hypothetical protein